MYRDKDSVLDSTATMAVRSAWRLEFPPRLEEAYLRDHRARAVALFRVSSIFILLLYILLGSGIYPLMSEGDVLRWAGLYSWVGIIIATTSLIARLEHFDRWFEIYVGLGSFVSVALSVAVTGVVTDPVSGQLTQAAVMYAMIIIYSLVGLRFRHALLAGWLGGAAGTLLAWSLGGHVNWEILHRTFTGASLLGMFIAYVAERRDRELFMQTDLLRTVQARTEAYAGQLDQLARQDPLTGLANRRQFDEELELEWRRGARQHSPLAVLMIDIDYFKHYNDNLGHVNGDGCLRKVAAIIGAHTRRPGDLAVRYGGEEFLLMFPDTDRERACQIAERLRQSFHDERLPQAPGLERDCITVSIGVAVAVPGAGLLAASELICAADDALYEAKKAGRDAWRYAADIPDKVQSVPELRLRH